MIRVVYEGPPHPVFGLVSMLEDEDYEVDFEKPDMLSECTDFNSGSFQLGAGESANGCVAYQLPTGVTPAKYQFTPNSGFASDFGEWIIP